MCAKVSTRAMKPSKLPTTSYGLIVTTRKNRVVLIKRKVPYCVQNFYHFLHKKNVFFDEYSQDPFPIVKESFEHVVLPNLEECDQLDYSRFINDEIFEDLYDFPHGQLRHRSTSSIYDCFQEAYREFQEETGYRFRFSKEDIKKYPIYKIEFFGCDNIQYTQYYFIVEKVRGLRKCRYFDSFKEPLRSSLKIKGWVDDKLVYNSKLLTIENAYQVLKKQQILKKDNKHLLLN